MQLPLCDTPRWSRRPDLNRNGLTVASTSSWWVYQFPHDEIDRADMLVQTGFFDATTTLHGPRMGPRRESKPSPPFHRQITVTRSTRSKIIGARRAIRTRTLRGLKPPPLPIGLREHGREGGI